MGPQDPKDVIRDTARDLSGLVGELAALKGDANHWLTDPEYAALRQRLETAHAAAGLIQPVVPYRNGLRSSSAIQKGKMYSSSFIILARKSAGCSCLLR
jgi:hypothetical protein